MEAPIVVSTPAAITTILHLQYGKLSINININGMSSFADFQFAVRTLLNDHITAGSLLIYNADDKQILSFDDIANDYFIENTDLRLSVKVVDSPNVEPKFQDLFPGEGIQLTSSHLAREPLVERMLDGVKKNRFFLITGPPKSGKTSLLKLFARHLAVTSPGDRCVPVSCGRSGFELLKHIGIDLDTNRCELMADAGSSIIVMLDNAHEIYGEDSFWSILMKVVCNWLPSNVRFIISANHSFIDNVYAASRFPTFTQLKREDLLLTRDEFNIVMSSYMALPPHWNCESLKHVLWRYTNGNLGQIRICCKELKDAFRKEPNVVESMLFGHLFSHHLTTELSKCFGSRIHSPDTEEVKNYFYGLFDGGQLGKQPETSNERDERLLLNLRRSEVLLSDRNSATLFSSPLAVAYFVKFLFPPNNGAPVNSLLSLGKSMIKILASDIIGQSKFPQKKEFRHILMNALSKSVPKEYFIFSELAKVLTDSGNDLSFLLTGKSRWGIEVLINDDRTEDAFVDKFSPSGSYQGLKVEDYLVIDIRSEPSPTIRRSAKKITAVLDSKAISQCSLLVGNEGDSILISQL